MTSIFVAKLDFGVTSEQLRKLFEQHGKVLKANVATDRETGKSRGFAFVEMADSSEAMNAIRQLDGHVINGRPIAVKEADQRGDKPTSGNKPHGNNNNSRDSRPPRSNEKNESVSQAPRRESGFVPPIIEIPSTDPRKKTVKEKDRKPIENDSDSRNKKPKMNAYKKSGKNNRFFDDDDDFDEDEDLFSYKRKDEDDFLDDEEEEEDDF